MDYNDFVGGWFVGNFSPALFKRNDTEVGVKYLKKGFIDNAHFHERSTEFNFIVFGHVRSGQCNFYRGDFMIFYPGEISAVECVEDAAILVIRNGTGLDDKHFV